MAIAVINSFRAAPIFGQNQQYENPVSRKTEKNLAVLSSIGGSALAGITAGGITAYVKGKGKAMPLAPIIGIVAAGIVAALTLPASLYQTKVSSFVKEKEMDVFSRDKEANIAIAEGVNDKVKDEDVSLDEKINTYFNYKMASNAAGLAVKSM